MITCRPLCQAHQGVVSSPHYTASLCGAHVLLSGGSAVDAAIATVAALYVLYPDQCSPGGDSLWLIYDAHSGQTIGINATGPAPQGAHPALFARRGLKAVPLRGGLSVTVPGSVAGWELAHRKYGTMPLAAVLQPAIDVARGGYPLSASTVESLRRSPELHTRTPREILGGSNHLDSGDIARRPDLADTLQRIATEGCRSLYEGELAARIVSAVREGGGVMREGDLACFTPELVEPIGLTYRDHEVLTMPPNSRGAVLLVACGILNHFDLHGLDREDPRRVQLAVECYRAAREIDPYLADPRFARMSLPPLLSEPHLAELSSAIRIGAIQELRPCDPRNEGDTVYIAVSDRQGNLVSLIDSIYYNFGSGICPEGTGILLQNRGAYFSLDPRSANCIEPGKRPLHTLMPLMMCRPDGTFRAALGTMGGDGQPQTLLQIVSNLLDYDLDVQQAIEAPRWLLGSTGIDQRSQALHLEDRFQPAIDEALRAVGYDVRRCQRWDRNMGHAQGVLVVDRGQRLIIGGADPRGDGLAVGY
jgi:gamma-glutamyltranspeptidase